MHIYVRTYAKICVCLFFLKEIKSYLFKIKLYCKKTNNLAKFKTSLAMVSACCGREERIRITYIYGKFS